MNSDQNAQEPELSDVEVAFSRRYFSAHHFMMNSARLALELARTPEFALVAIAMSALAVEALVNAVGERIFEEWGDFDGSLSTWGKYRLVCRELKIPCKKGQGVWQRLHSLLGLRNRIVHAKPEMVEQFTELGNPLRYHSGNLPRPKSRLEEELTLERAEFAVQTVQLILEALIEKLPMADKGDIEHGMTSYRFTSLPFPKKTVTPD